MVHLAYTVAKDLNMRTKLLLTVFAIALLVAIAPALPQKHSSPTAADQEQQRHSVAVNIVRSINTAEANYSARTHTFVTWDTLIANGDFTERGTKWSSESFPTVAHAMFGSGPEIVPGWKLRLRLSNGGTAYDLLLQDVTDTKCGFAAYSNETGLIWQSKTIDCPI